MLPHSACYCILFSTHCQISERTIPLKLEDCLAAQTWRHLQAIRLAHGLGFGAYLAKPQAVERLAAWLGGKVRCTSDPIQMRLPWRKADSPLPMPTT
jgi:hypothetical protein